MEEHKNALVIFGAIAGVAVLGLVFLFVENQNATGLPAYNAYETYGVPSQKTEQKIVVDGKTLKWEVSAEQAGYFGLHNVPESAARDIMATGQYHCMAENAEGELWTCTPVASKIAPAPSNMYR